MLQRRTSEISYYVFEMVRQLRKIGNHSFKVHHIMFQNVRILRMQCMYFTTRRVWLLKHNLEKLQSLNKPVARINALHSSRVAATPSSDGAGGLHATLFLAEGATVMLTANLWQEVGLCNGTPGTVFKILYPDDGAPPDLPIAVVINFHTYTGPTFIPLMPTDVPVPPITFEWLHSGHHLSRQQLPIQLSYAITVKTQSHKKVMCQNSHVIQ